MNKTTTLALIIFAAAASRLLPHPDNVTPIAAMALFAGTYFDRKAIAFAVPLLAMLASDAVIGFYPQMWLTYAAFALVVGIGFLLRGHVKFMNVAMAMFSSSVLFFVITNFTPLMHPSLYPDSLEGIIAGYEAALPFFRNTVLGDMFYTALMFGGMTLANKRFLNKNIFGATFAK